MPTCPATRGTSFGPRTVERRSTQPGTTALRRTRARRSRSAAKPSVSSPRRRPTHSAISSLQKRPSADAATKTERLIPIVLLTPRPTPLVLRVRSCPKTSNERQKNGRRSTLARHRQGRAALRMRPALDEGPVRIGNRQSPAARGCRKRLAPSRLSGSGSDCRTLPG